MSRSAKLSRYSAVDLSMSQFMFPMYVAKTGANLHQIWHVEKSRIVKRWYCLTVVLLLLTVVETSS